MKKTLVILVMSLLLGWLWVWPSMQNLYYEKVAPSSHICDVDLNHDGFSEAMVASMGQKLTWSWYTLAPSLVANCDEVNKIYNLN